MLGMLGLGAIGAPIAERLLSHGHMLALYDIRGEAMAPFAGRAELASSPGELADSAHTIIGCLPSLEAYRSAILDEDGVRRGRAIRRYIHIGTTGSDLVREIGDALKSRGIESLDAPVTGGVPRARRGELTVIAAGSAVSLQECEPILRAYGDKIIHVGEALGSAQTIKLMNNMLSAANLALVCEALVFSMRAGIDPRKALEVINNGTGQSNASLTKVPDHVLTGGFDYGGSMRITLKDTLQYEKEARDAGAPSLLASAIAQAYRAASSNGFEDADMTAIALHFAQLANLAPGNPFSANLSPPRAWKAEI